MIPMPAMRLVATALCCAIFGLAHAQGSTPLTVPFQETQLVGLGSAAAPIQQSFTIATAEDLVVTLTDLQIPAELVSAGVVVTQSGAIVGSGQLAAPATNASVSLPAASGVYTLYVFGVPNPNYSFGSFSVCVAPKTSPSNCIQTASVAGLLSAPDTAKDPTVSTLSTTLNVTTAGSYTFNFSDLSFPVALNTPPSLALFQGSTPIIPPGQTSPGITAGTALTLSPGTYTLLSIAQADQTVKQGLYNISITGAAGSAPLVGTAVPVGALAPATAVTNPSAQMLTLTVADYGFPGALASATALLTSGGNALGSATAAGGAQTFAAPTGSLSLWIYGSMGTTAGTFSADVSAGSTDLATVAQGVGPSGTGYTYAYVEQVTTAGAFAATATDLQFPSQLAGLSFAVAQNGLILQQSTTSASLSFNAVAGNIVLLVSAQAPASASAPNGLFDVNVQSPSGATSLVCTPLASAALTTGALPMTTTTPAATAPASVCDQTQSVSATPVLFNEQALSVAADGSYDVSLTDLMFPKGFDSLALVVSRGSQVLGKIFGAGKFTFTGTPGTYQLTFVASPSADQQFGLFGVSAVDSPPTVTLTSSLASAATGSSITLSFSSTNATSCTASGGWTGTEPTSASTATEVLSATTTYTLTCTGPGGTANQAVTVTATTAPAKFGGGGGSLDYGWLMMGSGLFLAKAWRGRCSRRRA